MNSYRTTGENNDNFSMKSNQAFEDQVSLRSLPMTQHSQQLSVHSSSQAQHLNPPRSMSPVSSMSGDELSTGHGGRRSQRRRVLDKQVLNVNIIYLVMGRVLPQIQVSNDQGPSGGQNFQKMGDVIYGRPSS